MNIISSIITVVMNTLVFYLISKHRGVCGIVQPILCSICGAGTFVGMVVQPLFAVNYYLHPDVFQYIWPCHKLSALIFASAFHLSAYGVLGGLALLSFYHLQAVSNPTSFRTRYTTKKSRKHVIYLWISEVFLTAVCHGVFWEDTRIPGLLFYAGASILAFLIIAIQLWTFCLLKRHNNNMVNPETGEDSLSKAAIKRARTMAKTSALIFAALIVFCLPVVVAAIISVVSSDRDKAVQKAITERNTLTKTLLINLQVLIFFFPAFYPFILSFMNKKLAKILIGLAKSFCCCLSLVALKTSRSINITAVDGPVTHVAQ
jgi:hypothetical protein